MRWTQALVVFGLAALLTFQVEQSSAATLRNAVASSEVDEALSVELVSDEHDLGDLVKDLAEKAKERLQKLREEIRSAIEKIKQQGVGAVAKDVAERIKLRLSQIREAAKKLAEALGETELGKAAKQVVKQAEEAIQKIKEAINKGKPAEPTKPTPAADEDEELLADGDLAQRLKERVEKVREAIRKELEKVKAMSKPLAERVKARFEKIREAAKKLAEKFGETQVGAAAKKLAKEAEEAIQKIKEAIKGKPAEPTKPTPAAEEDEELLAAEDRNLAQSMKEHIEKVRELMRKEFENVKGMSKAAAEKVQPRFEKVREEAKKLAERFGETQVGAAAKKLAKEAAEAIQKIKEAIKGKPAEPTKPTPAAEEDEELLAGEVKGLHEKMIMHMETISLAIRKELENIKNMSRAEAERVKEQIEMIRNDAMNLANHLRGTKVSVAAKKLAKEAEEAVQKISKAINGKPAEPTKPSGEEDEQVLANIADDIVQRMMKKLLKTHRETIRKELEKVPGMSKAQAERAKARFEKTRDEAKRLSDTLKGHPIGVAAMKLAKEAEEAIQKITEAIKEKSAEPTKPSGEEDEQLLVTGDEYLLKGIMQRIEKMRGAVRLEVEKLAASGTPKDLAKRASDRVAVIRNVAQNIIKKFGGNPTISAAAQVLVKEAQEAIQKIKGMPAGPTNPSASGEEDEELLAGGPLNGVHDFIKETIERVREDIRAVVDKIAGLSKEALERARAHIEKNRETAKKIAEQLGDTALGTAAKRLEKEAVDALNKIKEALKSKTAKPTTPAQTKPTPAA